MKKIMLLYGLLYAMQSYSMDSTEEIPQKTETDYSCSLQFKDGACITYPKNNLNQSISITTPEGDEISLIYSKDKKDLSGNTFISKENLIQMMDNEVAKEQLKRFLPYLPDCYKK